ncbi:MAG: class I SAM-dependent methyltransferase, partial [Acidobacteria bacterium]
MAEFDIDAGNYADALQRGLKYSGEDATHFARARVQWLARRLEELQCAPRSLLDFGCGTGASIPHLLSMPNVVEVTGIDVSHRLLEDARRAHGSPRATFVLRSVYEPRAEADMVFSNGVFHHIRPPERRDALDYVSKSLRPGGLFAFWENNP